MKETTAQDHYERLLGPVYTWMAGGFEAATARGARELEELGLRPEGTGLAVDLGAGFGMHAIPLAQRGFEVTAIDTCAVLLDELRARADGQPVHAIQDDLLAWDRHVAGAPELVLCMGDTLTHLPDRTGVLKLLDTVSTTISPGGHMVLSIRDYTTRLEREQRFIPVRSDRNRIFTCFLDYTDDHVLVHDLLYEWDGERWTFDASCYPKIRITPEWLETALEERGFSVERGAGASGMIRFVARRTRGTSNPA